MVVDNLIGEVELGLGEDNVGLQSIHSGGAMAMFLSGVSEYSKKNWSLEKQHIFRVHL